LCGLLAAPVAVWAQNYPVKPVRVITPTAAGGSLDTIARTMAQKLSENMGQQFVVDNRPGAGGMLGAEAVARAAPDGYMVLIASNGNIATTQALYKKVPYDPVKDFAPVVLMAETPYAVVVHASMPVKSVAEFIRFARTHPGQINYASSGNGSTPHLAAELFRSMTGLVLVHVPYKGSPAALNSLLSGETVFKITGLPLSYPHIKAGRIRGLAVASARHVSSAPELPTVNESGLPGYLANSWAGLLVPTGTPDAIAAKLNSEIMKTLAQTDVKKLMVAQGFEVLGSTPEEFGSFLKSEIVKWDKVIRESKARVE
jgi:tripartite-type tricarboxylate transporter receptor subunit TctC